MTNLQKILFVAAIALAGIISGVAMVSYAGANALTLGLAAKFLSAAFVLSVGALAVFSAREGRHNLAVASMAIALMCGYQQITNPLELDVTRSAGQAFASVVQDGDTASVSRQWDGHFRAATHVNGRPVEMLVDTGASLVLLTYEDASAAGFDMNALKFDAPILTANGRSHVATIELDSVMIGGVGAKGIRGAVAMPGQLHASLLGMSFLGAIEEASIRKDRLILRN